MNNARLNISFMNQQKGFSLIELIAVIVILGVLATATFKYIEFGTEAYVFSNLRQQKISESRFLIERFSREIRLAIPNSIRIATDSSTLPTITCIEFVPIKASGAYRTDTAAAIPPIAPNAASGTIDVISWNINQYNPNDRMYIYPENVADIYGATARVQLINTITPDAIDVTGSQFQFGFANNVQFPAASPRQRYFTADRSISYCLINNSGTGLRDVYRFEHTAFSADQPLPLSNTGVLMAEGLTNDLLDDFPAFDYTPRILTQNSVVSLYLEFEADVNENMFYNHEVHIPNVP